MLSGALAVLDISLLGLQIIINLFCVLPPVSVIYRHVITFLKCIHYFSSKTSHYFSHGVQGNLHCTHVMVYTDHCTFTKVGAIYSLAFIINELVIWSLFHCLIVLSLSLLERHRTIANRILNSDSGLFATPHFVPGLLMAPSPRSSHHRGGKTYIKYEFVQGGVFLVGGCELKWSPDLRLLYAKKLPWDGLLKVSAVCCGWLDRHLLASNLNLKPSKKKVNIFALLFFPLAAVATQFTVFPTVLNVLKIYF